jgi:hypothetical protein
MAVKAAGIDAFGVLTDRLRAAARGTAHADQKTHQ